jgi:hypothetical protein
MKKTIIALQFILLFSTSACASQVSQEKLNIALKKQKKFLSHVKKKDKLIIVDYGRSIVRERLWVYDLKLKKIIFKSRVGHAGKSGILFATDFSNVPKSKKSSIGSFVTLQKYHGSFGKSLRIKGLERGVNHNAHKRAIVIHPMNGHPWSYGCFTLPKNKVSKFVDMVKGGVFMYVTN